MIGKNRNLKGFITVVLVCLGMYMMDMKEMEIMKGYESSSHHHSSQLSLQSNYDNSVDTAQTEFSSASDVEYDAETIAMQQDSNLDIAEDTDSTSTSVTEPTTSPTVYKEEEETIETCPEPKENDASLYPPGFPQVLRAGNFTSESAHPYLSKDIWAELVDNKRTFFLRPYEDGFPNTTTLRKWVASRPHPITIVMNNYMDLSFPPKESGVRNRLVPAEEELVMVNDIVGMLNETNLHALYVESFSSRTNVGLSSSTSQFLSILGFFFSPTSFTFFFSRWRFIIPNSNLCQGDTSGTFAIHGCLGNPKCGRGKYTPQFLLHPKRPRHYLTRIGPLLFG